MASSNRHWPSMFKSKPCNAHHQWQHDNNPSLMSSCQKSPYSSGCEERSPEPKPRWNPKPDQIRILEAIFNSGMVNPPRDEIRRIRAQLQEFGQVGDANVFYWFQNRKSRSKHKQRHLSNSKSQQSQSPLAVATTSALAAPSSSSSSSSDRTSPKRVITGAMNSVMCLDPSNSPTASVNQPLIHGGFSAENFFFPVHSGTSAMFLQGFGCPEFGNMVQVPDQVVGNYQGVLFTEFLNQGGSRKEQEEKMKLQQQEQQLSYPTDSTAITTTTSADIIPSTTTSANTTSLIDINQVQGVGESGDVMVPATAARSTVFINDMAFEVCLGPFNVREAFGDDVILINSCFQPVPINEWGVTIQSLQPGAFYYLARTSNMFDYLTTC